MTTGKLSRVLTYLNLAAHIVFLIPMMTLGITIEDAVLIYMISVFVYTLMQAITYRVCGAPKDNKSTEACASDEAASPIDSEIRKREAKGITADASPIKNATPVTYEFEPVRVEAQAEGGESEGENTSDALGESVAENAPDAVGDFSRSVKAEAEAKNGDTDTEPTATPDGGMTGGEDK